jgi:hypothetical protein
MSENTSNERITIRTDDMTAREVLAMLGGPFVRSEISLARQLAATGTDEECMSYVNDLEQRINLRRAFAGTDPQRHAVHLVAT